MHQTENEDDGYLGSGVRLINSVKKHGRENHIRTILHKLKSREDMIAKEIEIVDEKLLKDPLCMNIKLGGRGGTSKGFKFSSEMKSKLREAWTKKRRQEKSLNQLGEKNHMFMQGHKQYMFGKKHTQESLDKITVASKTRPRKPHPQETKDKMSVAAKARGMSHITQEIQDRAIKTKVEKFGRKLKYKGVDYLSVEEALRETGDSRYIIKKNCEFK